MPEASSNRFGLPTASVAALQAVLMRFPRVERAEIYGSRAEGNYRHGSDIDLTLFGEALTQDDLLKIEGEFDGLPLPYRVDLSLHAQIDDPALRAHIERIGQVFYCRDTVVDRART